MSGHGDGVNVIMTSSQDSAVDRNLNGNVRADVDFYSTRLQESIRRERASFDDLENIWKHQKHGLQSEIEYWRKLAEERFANVCVQDSLLLTSPSTPTRPIPTPSTTNNKELVRIAELEAEVKRLTAITKLAGQAAPVLAPTGAPVPAPTYRAELARITELEAEVNRVSQLQLDAERKYESLWSEFSALVTTHKRLNNESATHRSTITQLQQEKHSAVKQLKTLQKQLADNVALTAANHALKDEAKNYSGALTRIPLRTDVAIHKANPPESEQTEDLNTIHGWEAALASESRAVQQLREELEQERAKWNSATSIQQPMALAPQPRPTVMASAAHTELQAKQEEYLALVVEYKKLENEAKTYDTNLTRLKQEKDSAIKQVQNLEKTRAEVLALTVTKKKLENEVKRYRAGIVVLQKERNNAIRQADELDKKRAEDRDIIRGWKELLDRKTRSVAALTKELEQERAKSNRADPGKTLTAQLVENGAPQTSAGVEPPAPTVETLTRKRAARARTRSNVGKSSDIISTQAALTALPPASVTAETVTRADRPIKQEPVTVSTAPHIFPLGSARDQIHEDASDDDDVDNSSEVIPDSAALDSSPHRELRGADHHDPMHMKRLLASIAEDGSEKLLQPNLNKTVDADVAMTDKPERYSLRNSQATNMSASQTLSQPQPAGPLAKLLAELPEAVDNIAATNRERKESLAIVVLTPMTVNKIPAVKMKGSNWQQQKAGSPEMNYMPTPKSMDTPVRARKRMYSLGDPASVKKQRQAKEDAANGARNTAAMTTATTPTTPLPQLARLLNTPMTRTPLISDEVARENKGRGRYSTSIQKPAGEREWTLEDFIVNPNYNEALDYAYDEVVRGHDKRACLPGRQCGKCKEFYSTAGPIPPLPSGPVWNTETTMVDDPQGDDNHNTINSMVAQVSRHRSAWQRPRSPVGFWRSDFPTTQEDREDKEEAARRYREMVNERLHEARRNGQFLFADPSFRPSAGDVVKK
ncbi:uncharacterized protein V1518DRAFT_421830 [Limtongia smithiae]|uniref:uncharacterized protein n=1 Tax=Limtongia smithiae TaxID=1125753 RepID=UPI0034CEB783